MHPAVSPQGGVHKLSADTGALDKDTLKLLKTQDIGYVKFKAQAEAKVRRQRFALKHHSAATGLMCARPLCAEN